MKKLKKRKKDIDGNTLNDTSKEDKIYVYNLHLNNKELVKVESINDDESQVITKTENGILIEIKDKNYFNEEDTTTINIDKKKVDEKLIYNLEMKGNSELLGSLSIGYRGLNTLNQVEEVASCNLDTLEELDNGILKRTQETRQKNMSGEEKNISTTPPKRKIQYFNKNTFNENLQIKRIEENEMWKMNGKDAKQIVNVFNNIFKKMEDINKEQMQNYTPYEQSLISESNMLKLIPYFSIVGIDNIEYEQITVRNTFLACAGITGGIFKGMEIFSYNQAFNPINNSSFK